MPVGDSQQTLLQSTIQRFKHFNTKKPIIICHEQHRFLAAEQIRKTGTIAKIILEPTSKNTAPAITLAALEALKQDSNALLLILPTDHIIENTASFKAAVTTACEFALQGKIAAFGITANKPETGYGYIKAGKLIKLGKQIKASKNIGDAFTIEHFTEKPNFETAQNYVHSGKYFWNSGMLVVKATRYLKELQKFCPDILSACEKSLAHAKVDLDFLRIDESEFAKCPADSIDYAIMEKSHSAILVPLSTKWKDIGTWSSIWDAGKKDDNNNLIIGDVIVKQSTSCLVSTKERLVSILGLDNIMVIDTKDALLVADKSKSQQIKSIVEQLKLSKREEVKQHREVYRIWGKYYLVDIGNDYQVKKLVVNPGAKLSLQKHQHRAEHWVIVSGTAKVTNANKTFLVNQGESVYIPIGQIHALENPGKVQLELIEVQTGTYLGEDDIVRLEDNYGRIN